jgi:hypothetical protein
VCVHRTDLYKHIHWISKYISSILNSFPKVSKQFLHISVSQFCNQLHAAVLLQKVITAQLVKKFLAFYRTLFPTARLWTIFWARWIQLTSSIPSLDNILSQMNPAHIIYPVSGPYSEPDESSSHNLSCFWTIFWARWIQLTSSIPSLDLFWVKWIQSTSPYPVPPRSTLTLFSHLLLYLPGSLFPSGFKSKGKSKVIPVI